MLILMLCSISFIISLSLMFISSILSNKIHSNKEKLSSFECGFISFFKLRSPFSLRFFIISLIFLIFDVEIIFILPLTFLQMLSMISFVSLILLIFIVSYGLIHEWMIGSLNWSI